MKKKTCFIITPIGEEGTSIRRHIEGIIDACIVPVLKDDFDISVSHRKYDAGSIGKSIIKDIYYSDLVIANLTALNPNVMYELAVRHCAAKPIIIIAEKGTILPFDIKDNRTIFYENDAFGSLVLKEDLMRSIKNIDFTGYFESEIYSILGESIIEKNIKKEFKDTRSESAFQYILDQLASLERKLLCSKSYNKQFDEELVIYNILKFNFSVVEFSDFNKELIKRKILESLRSNDVFHVIDTLDMIHIYILDGNSIRVSFDVSFDLYSSEQKRELIEIIVNVFKENGVTLPLSANSNNQAITIT